MGSIEKLGEYEKTWGVWMRDDLKELDSHAWRHEDGLDSVVDTLARDESLRMVGVQGEGLGGGVRV